MNILPGHIENVTHNGNLTLVETNIENTILQAVVIGGNANPRLVPNTNIELLFNASEVIIGKDLNGNLSIGNKLPCHVYGIKAGKIFSNITLSLKNLTFNALLTTSTFKAMDLQMNDRVEAFIKMNEIFIKHPGKNKP
jgi:molybdate transport system regulatory protein